MTLIADALERDIQANPTGTDISERIETLAWLKYRLARAATSQPVAEQV